MTHYTVIVGIGDCEALHGTYAVRDALRALDVFSRFAPTVRAVLRTADPMHARSRCVLIVQHGRWRVPIRDLEREAA